MTAINSLKIAKYLFFGIGLFYLLGALLKASYLPSLMMVFYMIGFIIGWKWRLYNVNSRRLLPNLKITDVKYADRLIFVVSFLFVIIYVQRLWANDLLTPSIGSRTAKALITRQDFIFSVTDSILFAIFWYHTAVLVFYGHCRTKLYMVEFVCLLMISVHSASLASVMGLFIPQLFFIARKKKITTYILKYMIPVFFLSMLWKPLVSWLIFDNAAIDIAKIDMPPEFTTWVLIFEDVTTKKFIIWDAPEYGSSYLVTIRSLLQPFWDIDPLSVRYAKAFQPELYWLGGGRAFSFILEAYLNYGLSGTIFIGLIVGYILRYMANNSVESIFSLFLYIAICSIIFKLFRSESYSVLKTLVWLQFFPVLLLNMGIFIMLKSLPRHRVKLNAC